MASVVMNKFGDELVNSNNTNELPENGILNQTKQVKTKLKQVMQDEYEDMKNQLKQEQ